MSRAIQIVSTTSDRTLDEIRGKLWATSLPGADAMAVFAAVRELAGLGVRATSLDLIGHSTADRLLVIGAWTIDTSTATAAWFDAMRPSLQAMQVEEIRLLGCGTAATERGRAAMVRIARQVRLPVLGARRSLFASDYGPDGFHSPRALVSTPVRYPRAPASGAEARTPPSGADARVGSPPRMRPVLSPAPGFTQNRSIIG